MCENLAGLFDSFVFVCFCSFCFIIIFFFYIVLDWNESTAVHRLGIHDCHLYALAHVSVHCFYHPVIIINQSHHPVICNHLG